MGRQGQQSWVLVELILALNAIGAAIGLWPSRKVVRVTVDGLFDSISDPPGSLPSHFPIPSMGVPRAVSTELNPAPEASLACLEADTGVGPLTSFLIMITGTVSYKAIQVV